MQSISIGYIFYSIVDINTMKTSGIFIAAFIFLCSAGFTAGDNLSISPENLQIEQSIKGGYDLWIKADNGIGSVLITESTADPEKKTPAFALRSPDKNPVNGDEKRMLNGKFLESQGKSQFALIDSTPEDHSAFGKAFHIFIPYVVVYGYPWSRSGEIQVLDGTWLNIRAFAKPYADYSGGFKDNPYVISVVQKPLPGPAAENYMGEAVEAFKEIAEEGAGETVFGAADGDIIENIRGIIKKADGKSLDLVLCLDTTKSMEDNIPYLKASLIPMLEDERKGFTNLRFGMVLYKDYFENYLTKVIPFQSDLSSARAFLNNIHVFGGRDIPEAVYEALYEAVRAFPWSADSRKVILIGDAPPHPRPRGPVTREMVYSDAEAAGVEISTIILPQ